MAKGESSKGVAPGADNGAIDTTAEATVAVPTTDVSTVADAPVATGPTPENTPPPGGGRWKWDIQGPGWVEST